MNPVPCMQMARSMHREGLLAELLGSVHGGDTWQDLQPPSGLGQGACGPSSGAAVDNSDADAAVGEPQEQAGR